MNVFKGKSFDASTAWTGPTIATISNAVVKLRWTDRPFRWHVNTGEEVFAVVDGIVDMHYREHGEEKVVTLHAGDLLHIGEGEEHVAHPRGEARILVVEQSKN
jgi:mannose-6-phosphate isomerase-like protein (cupin superfamily)